MLSAQARLDRKEGFSSTLRLGSRSGSRVLVVYLRCPSPKDISTESDTESTKAGIIVGKRQIPKSVDRNLVKRRLRHLLAERLGTVPQGTRIIVRALGPTRTMSFEELASALDAGLNRAMKSEGHRLSKSA